MILPHAASALALPATRCVYERVRALMSLPCTPPLCAQLITLEMIHLYVEVLDRYFGNVRLTMHMVLLSGRARVTDCFALSAGV